jgi:ribosome-binding protein aMBF1 (putative translation factor)
MTVSDIIRRAREKAGWTRAELSQKVGIDPSAISRLENGERLPGTEVSDSLERLLKLRKGTLSGAVIAEKKRRRERMQQLKQLIYKSPLSMEDIRRRLSDDSHVKDK